MNIQYKITYEDYLKANNLHIRFPTILRTVMIIGAVVFSLVYIIGLLDGTYGLQGLLFGVVLIGSFLYSRFIAVPKQVKRFYDQQKNLQAPIDLELSPTNMVLTSPNSTTTYYWKDIIAYKEDQDSVLLYTMDIQFVLIPKKYFPEEALQEIQAQIKENNTPLHQPPYLRARVLFLLLVIVTIVFLFINL